MAIQNGEMVGKKYVPDANRRVTPDILCEHSKMFKQNFSDIFIEQVHLGDMKNWLDTKIKTYTDNFNAYALYGILKDEPSAKSFISLSLVEPVALHFLNSCVAADQVKPDHELMLQYAIDDVTNLREALKEATIKAEMLEDQVRFLKEELASVRQSA